MATVDLNLSFLLSNTRSSVVCLPSREALAVAFLIGPFLGTFAPTSSLSVSIVYICPAKLARCVCSQLAKCVHWSFFSCREAVISMWRRSTATWAFVPTLRWCTAGVSVFISARMLLLALAMTRLAAVAWSHKEINTDTPGNYTAAPVGIACNWLASNIYIDHIYTNNSSVTEEPKITVSSLGSSQSAQCPSDSRRSVQL